MQIIQMEESQSKESMHNQVVIQMEESQSKESMHNQVDGVY
jgi:hypothetical protein